MMNDDNLRSLLEESTLTERKSFIRSFVKEVKVAGDEVLLTYTMPLPPQGIPEERVEVLSSVHYGGAGGIRTPYLLTASLKVDVQRSPPDTILCCPVQGENDFCVWL